MGLEFSHVIETPEIRFESSQVEQSDEQLVA